MRIDDQWRLQRQRAASASIGLHEQRGILHGRDPRLRILLAANPAAHPAVQRELAGSRWCWEPLGSNPGLAVEVQHHLASSVWADMQTALLRHPHLDPEVQSVLARSEHAEVRLGLAAYGAIVPPVAEVLARQPDAIARLAANPVLPRDLLESFLTAGCDRIRAGAARNPHAEPARLAELARDEAATVRRGVAINPALPPQTVDRLYRDREASVRRALVGNPAIGGAAAQRISDGRPARGGITAVLAGNPALPGQAQHRYAAAGDTEVAVRLAGNASLGVSCAAVIAGHSQPQVRRALAGNPALPVDLMPALAADADARVRTGLAANPALTRVCREQLAADTEPDVLAAIVARSDFDRADLRVILMGLVGDTDPRSPVRSVLRRVPLWDGPTRADHAVLDLPITGPAVAAGARDSRLVEKASVHRDALVRLAVLSRAEIDPDYAAAALTDPDPAVAHAARLAVLRRL